MAVDVTMAECARMVAASDAFYAMILEELLTGPLAVDQRREILIQLGRPCPACGGDGR